MNLIKEIELSIVANEIKNETGLDFSKSLGILAYRLEGKTVNQLIAEIKQQEQDEERYTE